VSTRHAATALEFWLKRALEGPVWSASLVAAGTSRARRADFSGLDLTTLLLAPDELLVSSELPILHKRVPIDRTRAGSAHSE
jgi:hypothetical protein